MIKKIYSKMTKERRSKFQIETCIYKDGANKYVEKRALTTAAVKHVEKMLDNYKKYNDWNIDILSYCEKTEVSGCVKTKYMVGTTLSEELLQAAGSDNRECFIELLLLYKSLIMKSIKGREAQFSYTDEFVKVFGQYDTSLQGRAATFINIDMAFDNIIQDENADYRVIDHEWIFEFLVPINFVFFRAIYAFYIRYHKDLSQFISLKSIYDVFGISEAEEAIYKEMDASFVNYVYGNDAGYNNVLKQYQKKKIDINECVKEPKYYAQLYQDLGEGFTEELSQVQLLEDKDGEHELCFKIKRDAKALRFDPINVPGVVSIKEIKAISSEQEVVQLKYNALNVDYLGENQQSFFSNDPQYRIELNNNNNVNCIIIKMQIDIFEQNPEKLLDIINKYKYDVDQKKKELESRERELSKSLDDFKDVFNHKTLELQKYKESTDEYIANLHAAKDEIEKQYEELRGKRIWIRLRD